MGSVGLLYVGAVLFINGVMLLGWVDAKSAAPMNFFVGGLQVVTPTYLIFTANGNAGHYPGRSGLYLFGFTYLYVAINLLAGLDGTGLGCFSLFVAVCAVVYSYLNFNRFHDHAFGVIWLYWAFLWALFFLLLGLKRDSLGTIHRSGRRDPGLGDRRHPGVPAAHRQLGTSTTMRPPSPWRSSGSSSSRRCTPCSAGPGPARRHRRRSRTGPPHPPPADSRRTPQSRRHYRSRREHAKSRVPARLHQELHRPGHRRPQPVASRHPGAGHVKPGDSFRVALP